MTTTAGTSALAMYRATRRRRRLRLAISLLLVAGAAAAAAAAVAATHTTHRLAWPIAAALAAGAALCAASTRVGTLRDPDRWRRGAEGEQCTAELLDTLPARRWTVWHDLRVPGSRANIDHLVVGPTGVWVVDTKSPRGEVRSGWRSVQLGGRRLDTEPVRWEAEVVADRLERLAGAHLPRAIPVRPIVAIHGAPLNRGGVRVGGVRVVGADRLVSRIRRGRRRITRADRRTLCRLVEKNLA